MIGVVPAQTGVIARRLRVVTAILLLVTLWSVTHRYGRFFRDGDLYAVQAMAKIHTNLAADIYLQHTSQDRFTVFSRLYAMLIRYLGLPAAEFLLLMICTTGFFTAAWYLVKRLTNAAVAWGAVALLIATPGYYGAYQIFSYAEAYLTARSLAEAMIVSALALHFHGWRKVALAVALVGMAVHPLMALPGVLVLSSLWLPFRRAVLAAGFCVLVVFCLAVIATRALPPGSLWSVMDANWQEVVRERSQFLFLRYWRWSDWELAALPFVSLTLTMLAIADARLHTLCRAVMLIGATGLVVALIGGSVGPIAVLVQGQAWRWMWVTVFTSAALAFPTAILAWRTPFVGPLCAGLLLPAWFHAGVDRLACLDAALLLWLIREHSSIVTAVARLRENMVLGAPTVIASLLVGHFGHRLRSLPSATAAVVVAAALVWRLVPTAVSQSSSVGTAAEIAEFQHWRDIIPPRSNVLLVPTRVAASFVWFSLQRPSYISVDQSSGVVFSPDTAAEIRRRSEILRPIADPDWRILSRLSAGHRDGDNASASHRPLTATALRSICQDPQLGFVVAKEDVGFSPIRHSQAGPWSDWNLYDCNRVRGAGPIS